VHPQVRHTPHGPLALSSFTDLEDKGRECTLDAPYIVCLAIAYLVDALFARETDGFELALSAAATFAHIRFSGVKE